MKLIYSIQLAILTLKLRNLATLKYELPFEVICHLVILKLYMNYEISRIYITSVFIFHNNVTQFCQWYICNQFAEDFKKLTIST